MVRRATTVVNAKGRASTSYALYSPYPSPRANASESQGYDAPWHCRSRDSPSSRELDVIEFGVCHAAHRTDWLPFVRQDDALPADDQPARGAASRRTASSRPSSASPACPTSAWSGWPTCTSRARRRHATVEFADIAAAGPNGREGAARRDPVPQRGRARARRARVPGPVGDAPRGRDPAGQRRAGDGRRAAARRPRGRPRSASSGSSAT